MSQGQIKPLRLWQYKGSPQVIIVASSWIRRSRISSDAFTLVLGPKRMPEIQMICLFNVYKTQTVLYVLMIDVNVK